MNIKDIKTALNTRAANVVPAPKTATITTVPAPSSSNSAPTVTKKQSGNMSTP